jgi:hypothetical protein
MAGPRIGRAAVLLGQPEPTSRDVVAADIAAQAEQIADSLARLTLLTPSVGRLSRGEVERLARLHSLRDRAVALWFELAELAREARAKKGGA